MDKKYGVEICPHLKTVPIESLNRLKYLSQTLIDGCEITWEEVIELWNLMSWVRKDLERCLESVWEDGRKLRELQFRLWTQSKEWIAYYNGGGGMGWGD